VTRSVTKTRRDEEARVGTDETTQSSRVRRMVTAETDRAAWDWVRGAHNPEVAGSNPAPATNVVAGQRPFPIGRGPLACVARDQIRDQIRDQGRLIRSAPSHNGTPCDRSRHLRCDRWVKTLRSHGQVTGCHRAGQSTRVTSPKDRPTSGADCELRSPIVCSGSTGVVRTS
jgi:hypothetical protein